MWSASIRRAAVVAGLATLPLTAWAQVSVHTPSTIPPLAAIWGDAVLAGPGPQDRRFVLAPRGPGPLFAPQTAIASLAAQSIVELPRGAREPHPYITILCRFADSPDKTPAPPSHYAAFFEPGFPSVAHYWAEVSDDRLSFTGSATVGWYDLPSPRAYYVTPDGARLSALAADCTKVADPDVFFPAFSGVVLQFNEALDCCSWGGRLPLTLDGVERTYGVTWQADWVTQNVGFAIHEVGHSLGLPHSGGPYGASGDSWWDSMSHASWFRVGAAGVGTHTIAYHKSLLGWIPAERHLGMTGALRSILIERTARPSNGDAYLMARIPIPGSPGQFYTIEGRRSVGYDAPVPLEGVVIHRVDPNRTDPAHVVDPNGNGNVNNAGAAWTPGETFLDPRSGISVSVDSATPTAFGVTIRIAHPTSPPSSPASRDTVVVGRGETVARSGSLVLGLSESRDSVIVVPDGGAPVPLSWFAVSRTQRTTFLRETPTALPGRGEGRALLRWVRIARRSAPGIDIDTIDIVVNGQPRARIIDTLLLLEPPTFTATRAHTDSALTGRPQGDDDSVRVNLRGWGADSLEWIATARSPRITLRTAAGRGNGTLQWHRAAGQLPVGVAVDTIALSAPGARETFRYVVDTIVVQPPVNFDTPFLVRGGHDIQGARVPRRDSVRIPVSGYGAVGAGWSAVARAPWSALTANRGTGASFLHWTRSATSLPVGTYVDTIVVRLVGTDAVLRLVDSLTVEPPPSRERAAAAILGTGQLTPAEARFLDEAGNADGTYNLGDYLALLERGGEFDASAHGASVTPRVDQQGRSSSRDTPR